MYGVGTSFSCSLPQVLALNRGEQNKILSVKLTIPTRVENQFLAHLRKTWIPSEASGKSGCHVCLNYFIAGNFPENVIK